MRLTRDWRKTALEELHDLYSLSSITPLIKSIRMRRAGHVTPMRETRAACKVLVGKSGSHSNVYGQY